MSQKFNHSQVISISLKSHNQQQLFSIAETYSISFETLVKMKEDGFTKIWVEIGGKFVIACQHKSCDEDLIIKDNFRPLTKKDHDFLKSIKPVKVPKMPKTPVAKANYRAFVKEGFDIKTASMDSAINGTTSSQVINKTATSEVLEVDAILDKISAFGMSSLTEREKKYLEDLSKQ
jgi:hypothetical protein